MGATLSFSTPYVNRKFDICSKILHNYFRVFTHVSDFTVTKTVYRNYPIFVSHRFTHMDLVEFDRVEFDIIL